MSSRQAGSKASPATQAPSQSLWRRYTTLTPRTRIIIGVSVMAYATFATYATDSAEKAFGLEASEKDKEELQKWVPKVSMVDRPDAGAGR